MRARTVRNIAALFTLFGTTFPVLGDIVVGGDRPVTIHEPSGIDRPQDSLQPHAARGTDLKSVPSCAG